MDYCRNEVFDTHGKEGETWVGFDLDGTLALKVGKWKGIEHIGDVIKPVAEEMKRIRDKEGMKVKIFTARVADKERAPEAKKYIDEWATKNLGFAPEVTNIKDELMLRFFDDRCVQVFPNKGVTYEYALDMAMEIIRDLTDGYRNCKGNTFKIGWLVGLTSSKPE